MYVGISTFLTIMTQKKKNIGIVGGGIAGLTLALRLAQHGNQVTVFEREQEVGGLAGSTNIGEIKWDKFYHVILMSDTHLRNLLRELELEKEIQWRETKTGFYTDGQLYSMSNVFEFLQFPPIGLIDKFRLGATIFYASKIKNWKKLEKIFVDTWLRRWSGPHTYEKIWLPLLHAKLGDCYSAASAAFIWATIQRMYAARRTGLKKEMFGFLPGGYARIFETFKRKLKEKSVSLKTDCEVIAVSKNNNHRLIVDLKNGIRESFDEVVITIPADYAVDICKDIPVIDKEKWRQIQFLGVICVALLLKKSLSPYYVTNITETWIPFTGVIEMSALVDKKHFNNYSLIYLPKYLAPDDQEFKLSDAELKEKYFKALMQMHPELTPDDLIATQVNRAKYVFALSTIHYSTLLPDIKTSIPGLFIVNSAHIVNGTLNVNETIQLMENMIKTLFQ